MAPLPIQVRGEVPHPTGIPHRVSPPTQPHKSKAFSVKGHGSFCLINDSDAFETVIPHSYLSKSERTCKYIKPSHLDPNTSPASKQAFIHLSYSHTIHLQPPPLNTNPHYQVHCLNNMSSIKNVAVVGASGALGKPVLSALVNSDLFDITVLRRIGSSSTFPSHIKTVDVDYNSVEALTSALKGQDAVVSTVGTMQVAAQTLIIDAAVAAGVQRFIPSEFGSNLDVPKTRALPVFKYKVEVQDYLKEKAKAGKISYTLVYNSGFLDWGIENDFILSTKEPRPLIEDGNNVFSSTTLASVADAVVGVLKHPEETKNRPVYIEDIKVTQNKLVELARKASPQIKLDLNHVKLDDLTQKADERLAQGLLDRDTFVPYLYRAIMDPECGGNFTKTDNELLGIKGRTEDDIIEIFKKHLN